MTRLNIVIPMAGDGTRFRSAGYTVPKPFIDIRAGHSMIGAVLENLWIPGARFVLLVRAAHLHWEPGRRLLEHLGNRFDIEVVPVRDLTDGAARTVLLAEPSLAPGDPLVIANSDQLVDTGLRQFIDDAETRQLDGSIMVFDDPTRNPKWSYARIDGDGYVQETREKTAISSLASVGLYYFAQAQRFVDSARKMITANDRHNGEFYVCPVYNHALLQGDRVGIFEIPAAAMHGLGTPEDLRLYQREYSERAV